MQHMRMWTLMLVMAVMLPGPTWRAQAIVSPVQRYPEPVQTPAAPIERVASSARLPAANLASIAKSAIRNPQSAIQETGVYTETFTTYTAKEYTENAEWDIWAQTLRLSRTDGIEQDLPQVAADGSGGVVVVWQDIRTGNWDICAQKLDATGNRVWAADLRVNSEVGTAPQSRPTVAIDKTGNAIVVWQDKRNGNWDIYAQKVNASGGKLWAADVRVNSDSGGTDQQRPAVVVDGSSNVIVVWQDERNGHQDIYAQKLGAGGSKLWAADVRINSDSGTAGQEAPTIAIDGSDATVVAWMDSRNGDDDVYAQRLDGNGSKLWVADVRVNSDSGTARQYEPAVAVYGSGQAVVVWHDSRNDYGDIFAQSLDENGNRLWAEVRVNSDVGAQDQSSPSVGVDRDGNAVVAWWDKRNDYGDIYAQKLDTGGGKLWITDVRVNSDSGTGGQGSPIVAVSGNTNAAVVWWDWRNGNGDIYVQKLDGGGERLWAVDVRVNSDSGPATQRDPALAVDPSGNAMLAWRDDRNGIGNIYTQKLDGSGNRLWAAEVGVNSENRTAWQDYPAVTVDGNGNAFVAWMDERNGQFDIYAQKLDMNGNRLWAADVRVNSDNGIAERYFPAAAVDENGNVIFVWQDKRNGNDDIYAQRLDASGHKLWGADVQVNSDSGTADQYDPVVAVAPSDGSAIIVWSDLRNGNPDIYAQRLDTGGNRLWVVDVRGNSDSSTTDQVSPAVALDPSGRAFILWQDGRNGNWDVYAQRLNAIGNKLWAADVRVNSDSGTADQQPPTVAVDASGNAVVAWEDNRNDNDDLGDLYAQSLDVNGNRLWPTDMRVDSDTNMAEQRHPAMMGDKTGNTFVLWEDSRNGNADIYVQRINSTGAKIWPADLQVVSPDHFYFLRGMAQSRTVDDVAGDIRQAMLTANYYANGGQVQFYLTNDGGVHWTEVTPGVTHIFTTTGSDLRWKAGLTREAFWSRTPVVNSLHIEYSTQAPEADDYEPDDTCAQARPIAVNGAAQAHTFHQNADADWAWFDVISGTAYIVQTSNTQTNADTTLELRASCPQPPLASDDNAFGLDARITWRATFSGTVYVKVANHTPSVYGADTGYDLSVRTYTQPPVAVIVGGHDNGYTLQPNIDYAADMAYRTFLNSGVPKANLRYLSPNADRDVDGNGLNDDIFATATITNVRDAVQDWSRTRGVALGVPFYVVLVDHGNYDQFLADGTSGRVFAEQLNLWLSNLEATSGADNINVIIEACHSGSFIDVTALGPAKISGRNRVVIASTSSALNAYPSNQGAYFSDVFWTALGQNQDLKTAFEWAKQAVQATGLSQEPWLDDNGDAVADSQDGALARGRGLGAAFAGSPPVIDWVQVGMVSGGQANVQAQVRDDLRVSQVRMVVYPPGFVEPPPTQDGTTPVLNVPTRTLTMAGGDLFSASYNGFTQTGQYRLVVYAQDADGNQALPQSVQVNAGGSYVYLPVVVKSQ